MKKVMLKSGISSRASSFERKSNVTQLSSQEVDEEIRLKKAQLKGDAVESPVSKQKYRLV
jgi:uncharacterized protein with ParB-like and HNH nuclease domain